MSWIYVINNHDILLNKKDLFKDHLQIVNSHMRRKPGSGNSSRSRGHDDARDSIQDGGDVAEDGEQAVEN